MSGRQLTPTEVLRAAFLHLDRGVEQQDLTIAFDVNNGRISEAVTAISWATKNHMELYKWIKENRAGEMKVDQGP